MPASRRVVAGWRRLGAQHGVTICFVWAVAEATVWPVIPDIALFLLILATPRKTLNFLGATVAGTTLGGVITLLVAFAAPQFALHAVLAVPLVHEQSVPTVQAHLQDWSLPHAFLFQPWSGIPFKLWAVLAVAAGHQPLTIAPFFVVGRALRFAAVSLVAATLGRLLERRLPDLAVPLAILFGPAGVYTFYRIAIAG